MATATKTWAFATTSEGWAATNLGTGSSSAYSSSVGNPAGSLQSSVAGKNLSTSAVSWSITGTWASLFGIPTNAVVTSVCSSGDGYQSKCTVFTSGAASLDGNLDVHLSATNTTYTCVAARTFSATDASWVTRSPGTLNLAIAAVDQDASNTMSVVLGETLKTGNSSSAVVTIMADTVKLTVTYTVPVADAGNALFLAGN